MSDNSNLEEKVYSSVSKKHKNLFSSELQRLALPGFSIIYPKQDYTGYRICKDLYSYSIPHITVHYCIVKQ